MFDVNVNLGIFIIVLSLVIFLPVRYLAKCLAMAYQRKVFSEPIFLATGLWTIFLTYDALMLIHEIGGGAYSLLFVAFLFPLFTRLMQPVLQPTHQPPTLLLLRVFRGDNTIEKLFDQVIERWRYSGNTLLIAGKDLALRNLEPDELFSFLNGRLQERFITDHNSLQQVVKSLDLMADPDGRFRINEFFCFDSTWKMVLDTLVNKADLVLMDLRAYTPSRLGCNHELAVLAANPHLRKVVILFDKHTEKVSAEEILAGGQIKIDWIDSDKQTGQIADNLLIALLT